MPSRFKRAIPVFLVHDAVSLGECFPTFRENVVVLSAGFEVPKNAGVYRGADKSLAQPGRKQETEDFEFHISYL